MNYINFQQIGGFPLETETLLEVQKAYSIFNAYGKAMGDKVIVSGCTVVGNNVSDGYIYLNDELISFKGGTLQSKIYIKEDVQNVEFADLVTKPVYYTRYATFGNTTNSIDWADFKRIDPILTLMSRMDELEKTNAVFITGGAMVLWNKPANEIPEGWKEVEDWRGRMPIGFDPNYNFAFNNDEVNYRLNVLGQTGGVRESKLNLSELPNFTLKWKNSQGTKIDIAGARDAIVYSDISQSSGNHRKDIDTSPLESIGEGRSHTNMSPYRTVLFIERIKP
ncbi:hypothetical protein FHR24_001510 [Wenyingzhuangia heitensis]|uniref:Microcystin-dependent protein n=1 Tax=Wenyingzhuangia heitensis TaxID=1487859 RepID=A0ABX0UC66_9FLAO|nr:hypothetical protein [Wenyingzhuangia heitensis]NIJ45071.1 hypothetical protein [Wenyingzhuangia heitensis]